MSTQDSNSTESTNHSGYGPASLDALPEENGREGLTPAQLGLLACLTFLAGGLYWTASVGLLTVSALGAYPMMIWGGGAVIVLSILGTTFWISRNSQHRLNTDLITEASNPPCINTYDTVTGLPTTRLFNSLLKQALMRARKQDRRIAVMLIEMNDLASITELQEQVSRNLVYRVQAARVKSALRTTDSVAKLAERTLAVLLDEIGTFEDMLSAVKKLQAALSLPFIVDGQELYIRSRIGICLSTGGHDDEAALLDSAAEAVEQARAKGYAIYGIVDHVMTSGTDSVPTIAA